jgi:hypothetical protein
MLIGAVLFFAPERLPRDYGWQKRLSKKLAAGRAEMVKSFILYKGLTIIRLEIKIAKQRKRIKSLIVVTFIKILTNID